MANPPTSGTFSNSLSSSSSSSFPSSMIISLSFFFVKHSLNKNEISICGASTSRILLKLGPIN
jgi:hypothetical protein